MSTKNDTIAPTMMPAPNGLTGAEMARAVDPWIAGAAVFLLGLGTVLVYSASAVRAGNGAGDAEAYLARHLSSILMGMLLLAITLRIPLEVWSKLAYPLLGLSVVLLAAVFVPGLGRRVNGAMRWISLGPASFQPGELAKLAVVVYLAHSLAKKREKASSFSIGFLPHVVVTSFVVGLVIIQPDIGTSAVIYATLGLMLFVAGTRISYLVLAVVAALPVGVHYVLSHPHAWARLRVFLEPEAYRRNIGYQVWESLVSFGSGGPLGLGLGEGSQKLYFLPESHTDFIFAVLGQELGFVGVLMVVTAFAVLVGRGLWLASRLPCRFPMFLIFGLTAWLGVQAFTNMAVVTALLPTKGLTLPLVSFGRSSLVVTMVAVGILLRASAEVRGQATLRRPSSVGRKARRWAGEATA
ncbi:MAG: putative lipid II flippase FtsW [Deltaproteobacteria bacterium]|nr:putative lipid II flippase FtsW [Deltaproteobacteria bacterium]